MRVAFYAPMKPPDHPTPSGDRRMARLLMAALRAGGHEVRLASRLRAWDDGTAPGRPARIRRRGEAIAARLIERWRGAADAPEAWFTYHLYHKAPDWIGPAVADSLDIPYLVAEASRAPKRAEGPWAEGYAAAEAALARADAVLAMSAIDADGLKAALPDPARLYRLPPFIDPAPFAAARKRRKVARRRLLGCEAGPWLIAVGMMRQGDKRRSYEILADALRGLGDRPWRIALVGDGPAKDDIVGLFDRARTRWFGILDPTTLADLYAAADLKVWPAVNEAYGMALLEAQAAGLPVVAGAYGGVPEVVRDGLTGLLTEPGDPAAFAEAVAVLLDDPAVRRAMGRAAAGLTPIDHGFDITAVRINRILRAVAR